MLVLVCNTLTFVVTSYLTVSIQAYPCQATFQDVFLVIWNAGIIFTYVTNLLYYTWTLDTCFKSFKAMLVPLR